MRELEQDTLDKFMVLHWILNGNKTQAYLFARGHLTKADRVNIPRMAVTQFSKDNVKAMLSFELENVKGNISGILERVGLKDSMQQTDNNPDGLSGISDELSKEQAKKVLVNLINSNKTDAKTVSQAMQLLSKLEQWEKEKPTENSNITFYELPKKRNS